MTSSLLRLYLETCWKVKATLSRHWDITSTVENRACRFLFGRVLELFCFEKYSALACLYYNWNYYFILHKFFSRIIQFLIFEQVKAFLWLVLKFWFIMYNGINNYYTTWMNNFLFKISRSFKSTEEMICSLITTSSSERLATTLT